MNEYTLKKALSKRGGQQNNNNSAPQSVNGIPNSVLTDVFAGKRRATNEMMGHREELAPSIAAKMSQSFGMDFSAVKVYRSDAMAGTEMHGMAQGDKVVLSSDVDLNTMEGQATLGHELSHIRAQSMGMGSGRGLLNDAALEHQADSEGILAARGMSVSGESTGMSMGLGMAGVEGLSPIGAGLGASAAAPMQASKKKDEGPDPDQIEYDNLVGRQTRYKNHIAQKNQYLSFADDPFMIDRELYLSLAKSQETAALQNALSEADSKRMEELKLLLAAKKQKK